MLALPISASAGEEKTPLYKGPSVEVNVLSDYESGTRLHEAGKIDMAITMFTQGVAKGDPRSMFALGTYYYFGEGVPRDLVRARELFQSASANGHAESDYMLSLIYGRGEGTKADQATALKYLQTAARGCVSHAQRQLAQMYYEGQSLQKDELNGIAWLALAAEHEGEESRATVEQVKTSLSPDQRVELADREKQLRSELKCAR